MAVERFITENGSITLEQMEGMSSATRVYFVVAQEETPEISCEVQFADEGGLGDAETLVCPYVTTIGGEHYYSSTYKPMVYLNLTGAGPTGPIPGTLAATSTEGYHYDLVEGYTSPPTTPLFVEYTWTDIEGHVVVTLIDGGANWQYKVGDSGAWMDITPGTDSIDLGQSSGIHSGSVKLFIALDAGKMDTTESGTDFVIDFVTWAMDGQGTQLEADGDSQTVTATVSLPPTQTETPTPSPSATPAPSLDLCFDDFGTMEIAVTGTDNQSTYLNGISVTSSIAGILRFKATQGAGGAFPSVYLCALEDQTTQFKITSTALSFDTTFMFESTDGTVYKGSLDTTTLQSGINTFNYYSCDALFTAESVELRDIYSPSQPLYEGLDTTPLPGDYFVGIRFENFSVNENSSFYESAFASTSETTGTGEGGAPTAGGYDSYGNYTPPGGGGGGNGYSSHSYAIVVHKREQGITDQMLLDSVEHLFDGRNDIHIASGTPTIGKIDDTFELELLTNDNLGLDYLNENFRLVKHDIAGIAYARSTTPDLSLEEGADPVGIFDHVAFNDWKSTDDLSATFFLYSTTTGGGKQVDYQQSFNIDSISGSITSSINELEITVDLNTGNTSNVSSITVKPTASGLTGTYNLYYDDVLDITTPVVYLVSLRNDVENSDFENGGLKITLTSDVVRPRIELVDGGNTYVGHLLHPVGTGMNYLDSVVS